MNSEKISAACSEIMATATKNDKITVIVHTKLKTNSEHEAQAAYDMLRVEQLGTRRAELLEGVQQRYGKGIEYCKNYRDSRLKAQAKVLNIAPRATSLWLADALAVSGTKAEIEDMVSHEDIRTVDVNPTFRLPEVLQTPLEDTPEVIDGNTWGLDKIEARQVWGGYGRGDGVLVGHLDTGVDDTHPALKGKVACFDEFDGMGNPMGTPTHDSGIHGTHTAGTICGRTFRGVNIGVAPDAQLCSALVLPGGGGTFAQIIGGMQYLIDKGVHIMNLSLGAPGYFPVFNIPIFNATFSGVLVVASIGNSGQGTSGAPGNDLFAVGVGATHNEDAVAGFSSGETLVGVWHEVLSPKFGPLTYIKPEISAPGVQVLSSIPGVNLAALNGTSMAAPHVAGATALLMSAEPDLKGDPFTVRRILFGAGREDFGEAGKDQRFGFGRIDAHSAVQQAVSLVS